MPVLPTFWEVVGEGEAASALLQRRHREPRLLQLLPVGSAGSRAPVHTIAWPLLWMVFAMDMPSS